MAELDKEHGIIVKYLAQSTPSYKRLYFSLHAPPKHIQDE